MFISYVKKLEHMQNEHIKTISDISIDTELK
jgi:hypothetical protein